MSEIAAALPDAASRRATFVPGDKVVVVSGDLVNLEGIVTKVRGCCLPFGGWGQDRVGHGACVAW